MMVNMKTVAFAIFAIASMGSGAGLHAQDTIVSGAVVDIKTGKKIDDVEIWYEIDGQKLFGSITRNYGEYSIKNPIFKEKTPFRIIARSPGKYIESIKVYPQDADLFKRVNFELRESDGLPVTVTVKDAGGNPVEGVKISAKDVLGEWRPEGQTDKLGEFSFYTRISPGDLLSIRGEKEGLVLEPQTGILANFNDYNRFNIHTKNEKNFPWCTCLWGGGAAFAVFSIGMFIVSGNTYDNYKDKGNVNREQDYRKANGQLHTAMTSGGVAILALGAAKVCDHLGKDREQERKSRNNLKVFGGLDGSGNPGVGIAYYFNR